MAVEARVAGAYGACTGGGSAIALVSADAVLGVPGLLRTPMRRVVGRLSLHPALLVQQRGGWSLKNPETIRRGQCSAFEVPAPGLVTRGSGKRGKDATWGSANEHGRWRRGGWRRESRRRRILGVCCASIPSAVTTVGPWENHNLAIAERLRQLFDEHPEGESST